MDGPIKVRLSLPAPTIRMKWACAIQKLSGGDIYRMEGCHGPREVRTSVTLYQVISARGDARELYDGGYY